MVAGSIFSDKMQLKFYSAYNINCMLEMYFCMVSRNYYYFDCNELLMDQYNRLKQIYMFLTGQMLHQTSRNFVGK